MLGKPFTRDISLGDFNTTVFDVLNKILHFHSPFKLQIVLQGVRLCGIVQTQATADKSLYTGAVCGWSADLRSF
jgi:hypothetical protein